LEVLHHGSHTYDPGLQQEVNLMPEDGQEKSKQESK